MNSDSGLLFWVTVYKNNNIEPRQLLAVHRLQYRKRLTNPTDRSVVWTISQKSWEKRKSKSNLRSVS